MGENLTTSVRNIFNQVAPVYDLLNHLFSLNIDRYWRKKTVSRFSSLQNLRALDVCTGTGDLAIEFAGKSFCKEVVGVDFSKQMLAVAEAKIKKKKLQGKIKLVQGDVMRLPFPDSSFDLVTISFGLRNLSDRKSGIGEIVRVLKKDGILAILEFSPVQDGAVAYFYRFYLNTLIPLIGNLVSSSGAYHYLASSIGDFPEPEQVKKLMFSAGLKGIRAFKLTFGIVYLYLGKRE